MQQLPTVRIEDLPEEFFIDLAVGTNSFLEICDNYDIDEPTANYLESQPLFQRRLRIAQQVVEDDGTAFRSRCRVAVANSVHHVVHMMQDTDVPASTQLDAFKTLVKYGGLEPQKEESAAANGPSLVLNIVAPDGTATDFVAQVSQKGADEDVFDAEYEEVDTPEFAILPPAASQLFGAS